jgi:hypothetical protein
VVLGHPHVVEAQLVDELDLVERAGVELRGGHPRRRGVAEPVEHAEADRWRGVDHVGPSRPAGGARRRQNVLRAACAVKSHGVPGGDR